MKRFFPQVSTRSFTTRNKMKRSLSRLSRRSQLALILLSFVAAATLITFVVSAARNTKSGAGVAPVNQAQDARGTKPLTRIANRRTMTPVAPFFAPITATLADDIGLGSKKNPGDTITYTATISNGASDALNVIYNDTLDSNTTYVANSVHASPIAFNDTYNWVGNTQLDTAARVLPAVTANDIAVNATSPAAGTDTFTLTTIAGGPTTLGGTVNLAANGSFVYTPPVGRPNIGDGATVADTFTYTIKNSADATLIGTGTVTINLTGRVWYLQAGGVGDGRSNTPSGSPAAMSTAADKSTDFFYIFSNAGSLNGPFSVDAGQQLLGQGVNLVVNAITLFTAAAPTPTTTNTAGNCVALAGAPGNNTLAGFNIGNCTGGTAITGANVGTLNVSTMSINTNGGGLDLTGVGTPTVSVVLGGLTSTGGTKNVNLVGLNGTFTLASGALSGATNNAFDVNGGNAGITYSGTISNSGARQVSIVSKTSGTVALSGAVSGTGTGIFLNANGTSVINFTGGVVLSTGANDAFTATSSGTTTVTGATNTLTTTTGQALKVVSTTVAATGLTFATISSNGGANNGITMDTTGNLAGLTVTGTGGTCTTVTPTCTGGTIQGKTGADGSFTSGIGIYLNSTINVSLTRMSIQGNQNHGIRGNSVTGFTLDNSLVGSSTINGTSATADTDAAGFQGETSVRFYNLLGSATISNSTLDLGFNKTLAVVNDTGTLNRLTITNCTLRNNQPASTVADSFLALSAGSATLNFTVNGASIFNAVRGFHITTSATQTSTMDIVINGGCAFSNTINPLPAGGGTQFGASGTDSFVTVNIDSNSFRHGTGASPPGVNNVGRLMTIGSVSGTSKFDAKITNNTFGVTGIARSGAGDGADAIGIFASGNQGTTRGNGTTNSRFLVQNNIIKRYGETGILINARQGNSILDATVLGNTINEPGTAALGAFAAIWVNAGALPADSSRVDVVIGSASVAANKNTMQDSDPSNATDVFIDRSSCGGCASTLNLYRNGSGAAAGQSEAIDRQILVDDNNATLDLLAGFTNGGGATIGTPAGVPPVPPIANFVPDEGAANPGSVENQVTSNTTLGNGGSNASPTTFAWLKQVLHPVAAFATKVNFLRNSEVPVTPALTSAERSAMIAEVKGISATQKPDDQKVSPQSGETITVNSGGFTLPANKTITIKYQATVNSPPLASFVQTQGNVTFTGGPGGGINTTDPETGTAIPTKTNINTAIQWKGTTSTDWNDPTNWELLPGPVVSSYAPGVSNPAVNDVSIPNTGNQPNISATDIGILSLNISNGRTLTITNPRVLTIGGAPGGALTLDGIISGGGFLNLGNGTHAINNAGGTGSIGSTILTTVLSGSTVTLNNNLQMGSLAINAGGSMDITGKTLSLNGPGAALAFAGGGPFTTTGSTVVYNGSVAQTGTGLAYNSLTINNSAGVTLDANASVAGTLALTSGDLNMGGSGQFTLTQPNTTASTGTGDVIGSVKRSPGTQGVALTFGNPDNRITFTTSSLADVTMKLTKATPSGTFGADNIGWPGSIPRTYLITLGAGAFTGATLRLHYNDPADLINGNSEGAPGGLKLYRYVTSPSHGWQIQSTSAMNAASNYVEQTNVPGFSPWTIANSSPTATTSTVSGRILDTDGNPVEGAVIRLNGTQDRKTITDSHGNYNFADVETNGFYTVTPSRVNFNFAPATRGFSALGSHTDASFAGAANGNHLNPLDTTEYFVRQQYVDFLGREPEEKGFNDWTDTINNCASGDASCDRVHVSESFFRSEEFQQRGYFVYRFYSTAFGQKPDYTAFAPDLGRVSGFLDATQLEAAKNQFASDFTSRAAFVNQYGQMTNAQYVDALSQTAGVTLSNRQALIDSLEAGTLSRAQALRQIAEGGEVYARYYNQAFVVMEYFGYLRRDPDSLYLNWISVLDANPADSRHMVEGFVDATEYRNRFKQ